ncbi:hypothetical protein [Microbacterium sp. NPDC086615]|uniref:hypothetical protein n=1 Tax=Microbacterium sp. NPDC086615 TaxID=3154865 RepID=UPI003427A2AC
MIAALTNPDNCGDGWVPLDELTASIQEIKTTTPTFGGIAGWEYFNSLPGGTEAPWKWAAVMRAAIDEPLPTPTPTPTASPTTTPTAVPAPVPTATPTPASGVLAASGQDSSGLVAGGIIGAIAVLVGAVALAVAAFRRRASVERWVLESRQPRD